MMDNSRHKIVSEKEIKQFSNIFKFFFKMTQFSNNSIKGFNICLKTWVLMCLLWDFIIKQCGFAI